MPPNSSVPNRVRKPRPDFPLFPHATGRWAKKVRGKFVFFGKTATDPAGQAALNLWLDQKDELLAGRVPRTKSDDEPTLRDLCNRFLTAKQQQRDSGELTARTWTDYRETTDRLVDHFGKTRLLSDLAPEDFEALRADIAKRRGLVSLGNEIQRIRTVFRYAYEAALIPQPMRFGPSFKKPTKKALRIARAKKGTKLIEAAEVKKLLAKAPIRLKAMLLLALNCGFGNADCATLPRDAVNLKTGWVNFPRPKTGVDRRCPLWKETVAALKQVLAKRPEPKDPAHADLIFITKQGGSFWKGFGGGPISHEFTKLLKVAKVQGNGRGFYALRHSFRTIADGSRDQPACDHIMGHTRDDMASVYRERIDDERLEAVVRHVREWLFPPEKKKPSARPKGQKKPR